MARYHDQAGRPIVAVTGFGVVTSLGIGKADNWRRLTAGESGIHSITRFATEGLRTRIAGTVDFIPMGELSAPERSQALAERVLNAELDHHLDSEASAGKGNHRNGYSKKSVLTETSRIDIRVPRDREGTFDPKLIARYQ